MESKQKRTWGEIVLIRIRTFVLKVINNERKVLTDHEIIDFIAEQIESVITQVCKKAKNRSCKFIRIYGGQVSLSLSIHIYIYMYIYMYIYIILIILILRTILSLKTLESF